MIKKLPKFKNYDEEAKFWDTHSVTDYGKVIDPKDVRVKKPIKMTFTVRLDRQTVTKLDEVADEKGIGPATLARMWLLEKLKEEYQTA
ncbi:MAG: CopG family antitoxin [Patescibacteria group bacterium]